MTWLGEVVRFAVAAVSLAAMAVTISVTDPSGMGGAYADEGQARFVLDPQSQAAMVAIRDLVANNHSLVTHRRMSPATARKMADQVRRYTRVIRGSQALLPAAIEAVAPILDELDTGAKAISGGNKQIGPIDGIVMMDEALARYARKFEHTGWKAPRQL